MQAREGETETTETTALLAVVKRIQESQDKLQESQDKLQESQDKIQAEHDQRQRLNMIYAAIVFSTLIVVSILVASNTTVQEKMQKFVGEHYVWIIVTVVGGFLFAWIRERFTKIDERFTKIDERFTKIDERFVHLEARMEAKIDGLRDAILNKLDARV